ncbi:hypothetical protein GYMLUDRAFT_222776 [Collybiopsis luxurians FD-317 M1]|uniref:Maleylacetate reductase n=1 Tax=Collybiopsis luxurians FD-317 M1 TaxID=944289 RepID=A0A0D0CJP3_9AGAR|nr:hypothetical protein GYMLUDRAFT_222776 [Collybiopsis luxurians FD-317 M1]
MKSFTYNALPARVIFGSDTLPQIAQEIKNLGCTKALVLTTPQQIPEGELVLKLIGPELGAGIYSEATMHTPTDITEKAVARAQELKADCVISVGGGSTTGLGKAIALRTGLKQIAVPTTYAGSEASATPIIGETSGSVKKTQKTMKVLPNVIVYDVKLSLTLPPRMTLTSGVNAVAHAVEALYSTDSNPIIDGLALQGITAIARALPQIMHSPPDSESLFSARSDALFGAWACGTCLGAVGMSLHHKICHTLGGTFNLPHADTHTVILPHAMAYNAPYAKETMKQIVSALKDAGLAAESAPGAVWDLVKSLDGPMSLRELGMREEDLDKAADIASGNPYPNPAPLERDKLKKLLQDAWNGIRPE